MNKDASNTKNGAYAADANEKLYAVWLANALKPGSKFLKPLMEKHGSFEAIYGLGAESYAAVGIAYDSKVMERLLDKNLFESEKIYGFCKHYNFGILIYTSPYYPKRLAAISDPPVVLYVRGKWVDFDDNVCIAVVGTRSYSETGWKSTYMISEGLAKCGAVVVTGLASGIDTAAARAALAVSGTVVGVLGTGIERIYPSENTQLFNEMYAKGTVITELPPFSETSPSYFPIRNRIISGLCHGVLVGEGSVKSGAMITAEHAAHQGRHLFAIPGDISSEESSGVNKLISEGAVPVFEAWNILEKYHYTYPHRITRLENANGKYVPPERSGRRIRVIKQQPSGNTAVKQHKKTEKPVSAEFPEVKEKVVEAVSAEPHINVPHINEQRINKTQTEVHQTEAQQTDVHQNEVQHIDVQLTEVQRTVYESLSETEYMNHDRVAAISSMPVSEVLSALTELELLGLAESGALGVKKK